MRVPWQGRCPALATFHVEHGLVLRNRAPGLAPSGRFTRNIASCCVTV